MPYIIISFHQILSNSQQNNYIQWNISLGSLFALFAEYFLISCFIPQTKIDIIPSQHPYFLKNRVKHQTQTSIFTCNFAVLSTKSKSQISFSIISQQRIQMENPLNLIKIREMIKNGISCIPKDPNCNQAIIVIGDTGVGKSTVMAFLSGAEMTVRYDGLKPILDCPNNVIKIGHEKYSQTSVPNKLVIQNLAFYDCPGFKDNKGEQYEISNSFFVQRLLDIYPKVKIVLMIDESHISESRADKLPKLTKNLLKSFKTFEDIKEGVIMIINRAERDLSVNDYHKEIKKMLELKNQRGWLFQPEEQKFLRYLMDNSRILLFKQPRKQDKNKKFVPTQNELSIIKTIKNSSFVKSKHILNILSQSAKLAIRDFIDEITNKSNIKIEAICGEIVNLYSLRVSKIGRDVRGLIDIKEEIINLAEEIKSAQKEDIVKILQRELPEGKIQDFSQDFEAVMFFKNIYDKTATYFSNLVNKIYSQLSHLLVKMDNRIMKVQKEEQEEVERQRQVQRRKQLQEQRERERQQMSKQMQKMKQLKNEIAQMGSSSRSMIDSLSDTMNYLNSLEEQFMKLKQQANKLESMNKQMYSNITRIESTYVKKIQN